MKRVCRLVIGSAASVGLALALLCGCETAFAHGSGGGHGGSGGHGHGVRGSAVARAGEWAGRGGGLGGYGYRHYGYGCCGWGIGFADPYWDSYLWMDYGVDDSYVYTAAPIPSTVPENAYLEPAPSYWYYCPDSATYYPYVEQCASAWQRVTPTPPR